MGGIVLNSVFAPFIRDLTFSGDIRNDVQAFFIRNGCQETAEHSMRVGETAGKLAERFGMDAQSAQLAGYLHDISTVFPNHTRIEVSRQLGVEVLPEEIEFPMIVHQKLSKVMAQQIFDIQDNAILDAVGCHTTLKKKASDFDKIVFVADKISWDQSGTPPYLDDLTASLEISLSHGAFAYIDYLWQRKETLRVVHPWLREAYYDLKEILK